jgi:hypothetical protein
MTHRTVARISQIKAGAFNIRERHNERKNEAYGNGDIDLERSALNVHFMRHLRLDGTPETYEETFNRLLEEGTIVKRGLRQNATLLDELVLDINTVYFDERGGYEFAKRYFAEAYRYAVDKVVGDERYVISAVMHADERNKAVSEAAGRDVYHYHLHVVFVPVVPKEIFYTKRCKDVALRGTLKEIIPQISHSNKFPSRQERDGKVVRINAYSELQEQYYQHMKAAGFEGFERGEKGSTREHLSDVEYKTQQEIMRAEKAADRAERSENRADAADARANKAKALADDATQQAANLTAVADAETQRASKAKADKEKQQKELAAAQKQTAYTKQQVDELAEVEAMGEKTLLGKIALTLKNWQKVLNLVKEALTSRLTIAGLRRDKSELEKEKKQLQKQVDDLNGGTMTERQAYYQAKQKDPARLEETIADINRQPAVEQEQKRRLKEKSHGRER